MGHLYRITWIIWVPSGVLGGIIVAILNQVADWYVLHGGPPIALAWVEGRLRDVDQNIVERFAFLAELLLPDMISGSIMGLIGGIVTAIVNRHYWRRRATVKKVVVLWTVVLTLLAIVSALVVVTIDLMDKPIMRPPHLGSDILTMLAFASADGFVFGMLVAAFAALRCKPQQPDFVSNET